MSVFELAVAWAIGHQRLLDDAEFVETLSDWFQRSVSPDELRDALGRMTDRGWVRPGGEGLFAYRLTPKGIEYVATLVGGTIRMIDRGLGVLKVPFLLKLVELAREQEKETRNG